MQLSTRHVVRSSAAVILSAILFACGGGGGGGSGSGGVDIPAPPVAAPPPPPAQVPLLITSDNAEIASVLGLAYGGIALGVAQLAVDWTALVDNSATLSFTSACPDGGSATGTLADRDGDRRAGPGDQVSVVLGGCFLKELDDTFDGTVVITLAAPPGAQQRAGVVTFIGFGARDDTVRQDLGGALRFDYSASRVAKLVHVYSDTQPFTMTFSDAGKALTDAVTALDAQHEARVDTVRVTTTMRYHLASNLLGGSVDVTTTTPWRAWFDTYPDAGELSVAGGNGSRAGLRAAKGYEFDVMLADKVVAALPAEGTGFLWTGAAWLPQRAAAARYAIAFPSDSRFRALIEPDPAQLLPNGSLVWLYSRPLDPLSVTGATFVQTSSKHVGMFTSVPARVSVEGGVLTVTPSTQLQLGAGYRLMFSGSYASSLRDTAGTILPAPAYSAEVVQTVSASLVASAPALLLGSGATLVLDGSGSSATGSGVASTRWRQLSGPPLALTDPTAPRITLGPSGAGNGIAVVELEVTNAAGDIDRKQVTVTVAADISQAFVIAYRTGNAPLTVASNIGPGSSGYVANAQANSVLDVVLHDAKSLRFLVGLNGGQTWRAGLKLDYGSGSTSGVYGPAWIGCAGTTNTGSFSVLDYALDAAGNVARLALDFDDNCSATGVTQGSIRYHSALPLRQ